MSNNKQKIRFIISKKQELQTYLAFLEDAKYRDVSREMNWAFYTPHPDLKILKDSNLTLQKRKSLVSSYIGDYYANNNNQLKKQISHEKSKWQELEDLFYGLVDDIFKGHKWPKGQYIAYPTIWGMFPRFLDNKTFQFPPHHNKKNFVSVVIAHEMLHFMFYDYIFKKYPKLKSRKYDFDLWNISEVFNVVIQNSPEWVKVFHQKTDPYPEHKQLISQHKKIWKDSRGDIDIYIGKVVKKYLGNKI